MMSAELLKIIQTYSSFLGCLYRQLSIKRQMLTSNVRTRLIVYQLIPASVITVEDFNEHKNICKSHVCKYILRRSNTHLILLIHMYISTYVNTLISLAPFYLFRYIRLNSTSPAKHINRIIKTKNLIFLFNSI